MPEHLLWIILLLTVANAALLAFLLHRAVRSGEGASREVREELRAGREEARQSGKELREEVTASLKASNDSLGKTLEALGKAQQAQVDGMARQVKDLAESQFTAMERVRASLDARVKELRDGNEMKLDEMRKESSAGMKAANESIAKTLETASAAQQGRIDAMQRQLKELSESNTAAMEKVRALFDARFKELQEGNEKKLDEMRRDSTEASKASSESLVRSLEAANKAEQAQLEGMTKQIKELAEGNVFAMEKVRASLDARVKELRDGNEMKLDEMRKESSAGMKAANETLGKGLEAFGKALQERLDEMTRQLKETTGQSQAAMDRIRAVFDARIKEMQEGNEKKLDEMRRTVDEKLHVTLEKRLGESFKIVSERLEAVHKGLGEMQNLASGVGDLKRVLTNVKVRGTWAEVQLGAILEQMLAPEQWERNVRVNAESAERVEFAIRLPGAKGEPGAQVWLPIDSKFPQEDYLRLQEALEKGDATLTQEATEAIARAVRGSAKEIHDKYIVPPATTDFAILYLATEGLFAEVVRRPALVEELQRRFRIVLAGPTTLAAILSSLRMGFQTLSIERRAAEVWKVLGAVKTEFGKFGATLEKVKRNLDTAGRAIEQTGVRSRAMERRLLSVERLPDGESTTVLGLTEAALRIGADEPAETDEAEE